MPLNFFHLLLIFLAEILVLYHLSQMLIQHIGRKIFYLTHSRRSTMYVLALLFLPGTILHEISHWIVARMVMVPTGEVVLWPRMEEQGFRLGSVAIAKTDAIRRFFIGTAPFAVGITLLFVILWLIINQPTIIWWHLLVVCYTVFEIGNTMFSSKRDLEGTSIAIVLFLAVFFALYLLGITLPADFVNALKELLSNAIGFLLIPISIDLGLVVLAKLL